MSQPELAQLEMLAQVDDLLGRLKQWVERESPWTPMNRCRALIRRVLGRAETLRIRLEAPLVVATFGGTGTGKSTLVNALLGRECTATGRERPTTKRPVLIAHPQSELDALALPLEEFELVRLDAPLLRDIVLIDCPDPDTTETESAGSNLAQLHQLLPYCDVLLYTTTQQKYRSARIGEELASAATGCRLLFVQSHADLDTDIREDWRQQLADEFEVPEMFFLDSLRALEEQLAGSRPSGDFARLQDLLTTGLAASQRVQIRRANLLDLIHGALEHCRRQLAERQPDLDALESVLQQQRARVTTTLADQLCRELMVNRNLWERRLLSSVTDLWGFSPFSAMLRFYNGLGSFIASFSLYRARNSAQMALIGALQGARWYESRQEEKQAEERLQRLSGFALDDATLQESQLLVGGYVKSAGLDPETLGQSSLENLRSEAARVEGEFLGDARRQIDELTRNLARKNSGLLTRFRYEVLFLAYIGFVLYRVGKNFFYDTFLEEMLYGAAATGESLLSVDFYISAAVFFILWSGLLVMAFTHRLRRGLRREIEQLAHNLAESRISDGLFPQVSEACRTTRRQITALENIAETTAELRHQIATSPEMGSQTTPRGEPVTGPNALA